MHSSDFLRIAGCTQAEGSRQELAYIMVRDSIPSTSGSGGGLFSRGRDGNTPPMRGLVTFIADLRNARARELEEKRINKELANIRQKFRDGKLDGYSRKKYVCKVSKIPCILAV